MRTIHDTKIKAKRISDGLEKKTPPPYSIEWLVFIYIARNVSQVLIYVYRLFLVAATPNRGEYAKPLYSNCRPRWSACGFILYLVFANAGPYVAGGMQYLSQGLVWWWCDLSETCTQAEGNSSKDSFKQEISV